MRSITPISCSTMMMVRFLLRSRTSRMSSISSAVSSCVMPADGSSSSSSFGSLISARQISMRRRSIIGRPADRLEHAVGERRLEHLDQRARGAIARLEFALEGAAPEQIEPQALIEMLVVADHDVVEDRQRQRQPRALEGAGNAGLIDRARAAPRDVGAIEATRCPASAP